MKPAQPQAPQNHQPFLLNAHEGYEDGGNAGAGGPPTSHTQPEDEEYEANVENMHEEDDENEAGTGVMPFVSEEFASF